MRRIIGTPSTRVKQRGRALHSTGQSPYNAASLYTTQGYGMSRVVKKRRKKMRKHKYKKLRKKMRHKRR
jgi:hypothetical protein